MFARSLYQRATQSSAFLLHDLGCQHKSSEFYLSSSSLNSITSTVRCSLCLICNQRYHKDFLPVYKSGVVAFLKWLTLTAQLPFVNDGKIQVSSLLVISAYWKEIIFDNSSTSITRINVDSLFLSLAATGILEIQNSPDGIRSVLGWQGPTTATTDRCFVNQHNLWGGKVHTRQLLGRNESTHSY